MTVELWGGWLRKKKKTFFCLRDWGGGRGMGLQSLSSPLHRSKKIYLDTAVEWRCWYIDVDTLSTLPRLTLLLIPLSPCVVRDRGARSPSTNIQGESPWNFRPIMAREGAHWAMHWWHDNWEKIGQIIIMLCSEQTLSEFFCCCHPLIPIVQGHPHSYPRWVSIEF